MLHQHCYESLSIDGVSCSKRFSSELQKRNEFIFEIIDQEFLPMKIVRVCVWEDDALN